QYIGDRRQVALSVEAVQASGGPEPERAARILLGIIDLYRLGRFEEKEVVDDGPLGSGHTRNTQQQDAGQEYSFKIHSFRHGSDHKAGRLISDPVKNADVATLEHACRDPLLVLL